MICIEFPDSVKLWLKLHNNDFFFFHSFWQKWNKLVSNLIRAKSTELIYQERLMGLN